MRIGARRKAANDRRDVDIDFGQWLPEGDTLVDASAHVDPDGLQVGPVQLFGTIVKVWIEGGEPGECYTVSVIATTASRIKEVCFQIQVTGC